MYPLWLFALAFGLRLAYLLWARPPFETTYWWLASSLRAGGTLGFGGDPITQFEPLYPLFLAAARFPTRDNTLLVQVIQVAAASLGAPLLYGLTRALTGRQRAALIAAVLYAVHPLLIRQAGAASESALITTLMILFAWRFATATDAKGAAIAGACLGLCALTRSMVLPLVPLATGVLVVTRRWTAALVFLVATIAVLSPFPIRNHRINGSLWPTRSGMNLYVGNSPYTAALFPGHDLDLLEEHAYTLVEREARPVALAGPQFERIADAVLTRHAVDYMAETPLRTLRQKLLNVVYFFSWRVVPFEVTGPDSRVIVDPNGGITVENTRARPFIEIGAHAVSSSFLLLAAVTGIFVRRANLRHDAILWCAMSTFVLIHAVYFPATRYRAPVEFALLFYAGVALDWAGVTGRTTGGLRSPAVVR